MIHLPHTTLQYEPALPLVMGILNVTPDSFSDGGRHFSEDDAIAAAKRMIEEGADIIDVGPESSRPGSQPVDADEQIRRSAGVIRRIRSDHPHVAISVDTRLHSVALAAIEAGADMINDITAGRDEPEIMKLAAQSGAAFVLMHMQNRPQDMQINPTYDDVVEEVAGFLRVRAAQATACGIPETNIIIDPGIGFGKTTKHNIAILRQLETLVACEHPVLIGASRKRFLGEITVAANEPTQRLGGSLACVSRAAKAGVQIVRVHDVLETKQFLQANLRLTVN